MKFIKLSGKLIKLTFPLAKEEIMRNKGSLILLLFLSIVLGAIPTIKSEMEAAVLQQVSNTVTESRNGTSSNFDHFLNSKLERLSKERDDMDFLEKMSHLFFGNFTLLKDLLIYGVLVILTWLINIGYENKNQVHTEHF